MQLFLLYGYFKPYRQTKSNTQVSVSKFFSISAIVLFACTSKFSLDGFNSSEWVVDKDGCNNKRVGLVEDIMDNKDELLGHGQNDIVDILGKPNRHELYSRNKKAFVYFVAGGPECSQADSTQSKLVIRFDGIGRTKEVIYYKN